MTRLRDVARRAGVSAATTSRVLSGNGIVSEELRLRVLSAAEELNYVPDGVARSMSRRRTLTLGLVVSDVTNPFFTAVARGVEDTGQRHGYSVFLCNTDQEVEKERAYLLSLREKRVDGSLLALSGDDSSHVQKLIDAGMRFVLIDRAMPSLKLPSVLVDNQGGVQRAVDYLLDLGHTRIGVIAGLKTVTTTRERLDGYRAALDAAGVPIDPSLIVAADFTERGGYDAGVHLWTRRDRPTAVISLNNVMTTGLLLALRQWGVRIPEQLSVIGFDDLPYFQLLDHPLTVITQPMYEVGQLACEMLLQRLAGGGEPAGTEPQAIRLPTELIVRESCRRVPAR
jgi:LacI family transcriptional regulator